MVKLPDIKEMMAAGMHFGHKTSKWNPKMKPYIYGVKAGVHIFDLEETRVSLETALEAVEKTVAAGGAVLFLGTKKQAREIVKKYARECNSPFVTEGWIGGTLTNWIEISRLIKKLDKLEKQAEAPDYEEKYTKRERQLFSEEADKLKIRVGGIREMKKIPDLIYVAGVRDENTAIKEAGVRRVKTVGIVDSNVNPDAVTYPIAANDDALKSLEMITELISQAVKAGQIEAEKNRQAEEAKKDDVRKLKK